MLAAGSRVILAAPPHPWDPMSYRPGAVVLSLLVLALPALAQEPLRGHGGPVRALLVRGAAGELVSGSFDTSVIVWDAARGEAKRVLRFHDGAVNAVAALADDCFASGGEDKRIAVWCGEASAPARVYGGHDGPVTALASVQGGRALVSAGFDGSVKVWAGATSRVLHTLPAAATALAATADGRGVIVGGAEGSVQLLPLAGQVAPRPARFTAPITALAAAGDGSVIAASADGHVRVLSATLALTAEIELDGVPLSSLALSPDGRLIATAGLRGGIAIIERASGRILARLTGPGLPVWSMAFEADSRTLLTGGADRVIRRWDAVAGRPLSTTIPEVATSSTTSSAATERGAVVFRACQACHTVKAADGPRAGPTLAGIMGRRIGTAPGYAFSDALSRLDIVWTRETIARLFEVGPAAYTPGTKMPEQTITDPADRQALVDWLASVTR